MLDLQPIKARLTAAAEPQTDENWWTVERAEEALVAHAPEDLAALVAEVRRLRGALTCDQCSGEGFKGYPDQQEPCPGCIAVRRELPGGRWYRVGY